MDNLNEYKFVCDEYVVSASTAEQSKLEKFFALHSWRFPLDPQLPNTVLTLDSKLSSLTPMKELESGVYFETDIGPCYLSNGRSIMEGLLGVCIYGEDDQSIATDINCNIYRFPEVMKSIFGKPIVVREYEAERLDWFSARLRIESEDFGISSSIIAPYMFWSQLISRSSEYRSDNRIGAVGGGTDIPIGQKISLGQAIITTDQLSCLAVGDIVRLDRTFIDRAGIGELEIGDKQLTYSCVFSSKDAFIQVMGIKDIGYL